jgi:carotenoid cleavage dioxygenase-like enzyme
MNCLRWEGKPAARPSKRINQTNCHDLQGALPKDLVGTLYRNGAGRIRVGERLRYGHWFDGACIGDVEAAAAAANRVETATPG